MASARRAWVGFAAVVASPFVLGSALHTYADQRDRLLPSTNARLVAGDVDKTMRLLGEQGVALVDGCINRHTLATCREILCSAAPASAAYVPQQQQQQRGGGWRGQRSLFVQSTKGRYHRTSFDDEARDHISAVQAYIEPFVRAFFGEDERDNVHLSQCQFLTSLPDSDAQFYHQDNAHLGLTVLIPLTPVDLPMGPTQLLCGTHRLSDRTAEDAGLLTALRAAASQETCKAEARFGQAVMYDARTLHRGMANLSETPRPVLVLRYDRRDTPPPGQSLPYTFAMRALGAALHTYTYFLSKPGPAQQGSGESGDVTGTLTTTAPSKA